jgi:hypothetical protein
MPSSKKISYINKDFDTFKQQLITFARTYYPESYNDFTEASPGMMFIEQASYVGDVLSFYADNQMQENFVQFAKQRKSLLAAAYRGGYAPKVTAASSVVVDVYQILPSTIIFGQTVPDWNYALIIEQGAQLAYVGDPSIKFYIKDKIDFTQSGSNNPTELSVRSLNNLNQPDYYLVKKQAMAVAGELKTVDFSFGAPVKFPTVQISDERIIGIVSTVDSDGNKWSEVPYLAQETIFAPVENTILNDPNLYQYRNQVPYLLKLQKVPRRFVGRYLTDNSLQLQFGAGISNDADEYITPNPENVGIGLPYGVDRMTTAYDPSNFMYTKTYGVAPTNTTLTVTYLAGGGVASNVPSNTLGTFVSGTVAFYGTNLNSTIAATVNQSLVFNNEIAATGGGDGDSDDDLRLNTLASYPTQLRTVTKDDYLVRAVSLDPKYGIVSKAYITQDKAVTQDTYAPIENNPFALNLYILSRNNINKLEPPTPALKANLKTFLGEYRMLTDAINILDAFIINIGIDFDIVVRPNYNNKAVLNSCLVELNRYFSIDNWQINQPIILANVYTLLDTIEGVQTVQKVNFYNLVGEISGYSKYAYDMKAATINGIIYPSLDPSIFEVKYPTTDIAGRVVNF